MLDFYEIKRIEAGRYQYGAGGTIIGECATITEAVAEIEKLQNLERGERDDKGRTACL